MRYLSSFATALALAALGFAVYTLVSTLQNPPQTDTAITPTFSEASQAPSAAPTPQVATPWPAIFGAPQASEPQPPKAAEPDAPSAPPLSSMGFSLKGIVQNADQQWAILGHPTGDRILKIGDTLDGGLIVDAISEQGIWVNSRRGRELLAFEEPQQP